MSQDNQSVFMESGSSLGIFMDCPKKYEFAYIKKLSSRYYQKNLGYGSFIHAFAEEHHRKLAGLPPSEVAEAELLRLKEKYPENHLEICEDHALARAVSAEWAKYWDQFNGDLGSQAFSFLAVEKEWAFPIAPTKLDWHLGKSDGLVHHLPFGKSFLYELKTSGSPDRESYKHKLEMDKQINSNLIAARLGGLEASGVIYDIIWKPALRLKKDRKTMPDETLAEFNGRILQEYREAPEKYFERLMVFRSKADFDDYAQDLSGQYAALRGVSERGRYYRNTNSCEKYGSLCPFFNACLRGSGEEEEDQFLVRDRKLPELSLEIQTK